MFILLVLKRLYTLLSALEYLQQTKSSFLQVYLNVARVHLIMNLVPLLDPEYHLCRCQCSGKKHKTTLILTLNSLKKNFTSATFRNSPTRSIRVKNFLYKSKASRHCFLFISKYFSNRLMMASL